MVKTLTYRLTIGAFAIMIALLGGMGAPIKINRTQGGVFINKGIYTLNVNGVNVTSFKLGSSLYRYKLIKESNILVMVLYNGSPTSLNIEEMSSESLAGGLGGYVVSITVLINRTCPTRASGWIGSPGGYPLTPVVEGIGGGCSLRLSTAGFPLTYKNWATFILYWSNSSIIIAFGPMKSSKQSTTTKPAGGSLSTSISLVSRGGNNTLKGFKGNSRTWASLVALVLGSIALVVSLVYEVGRLQ